MKILPTSYLRRMAAFAATVLLSGGLALAQTNAQPLLTGNVRTLIDQNIRDAAAYYRIDPRLIRAVVEEESGYNPWAVSSKGAMGLMQLMPPTAWNFGVRNPFNPRENIFAGALYLKRLLDKYGDVDLALAAYSAGEGSVSKYRGIPPYRETVNYINRISYLYQTHRLHELEQVAAAIPHQALGDHRPLQ